MAGKVTIIVVSKELSTEELEEAMGGEVQHIRELGFSDLDEAILFIVPSDDTEEQIVEEYYED